MILQQYHSTRVNSDLTQQRRLSHGHQIHLTVCGLSSANIRVPASGPVMTQASLGIALDRAAHYRGAEKREQDGYFKFISRSSTT